MEKTKTIKMNEKTNNVDEFFRLPIDILSEVVPRKIYYASVTGMVYRYLSLNMVVFTNECDENTIEIPPEAGAIMQSVEAGKELECDIDNESNALGRVYEYIIDRAVQANTINVFIPIKDYGRISFKYISGEPESETNMSMLNIKDNHMILNVRFLDYISKPVVVLGTGVAKQLNLPHGTKVYLL